MGCLDVTPGAWDVEARLLDQELRIRLKMLMRKNMTVASCCICREYHHRAVRLRHRAVRLRHLIIIAPFGCGIARKTARNIMDNNCRWFVPGGYMDLGMLALMRLPRLPRLQRTSWDVSLWSKTC